MNNLIISETDNGKEYVVPINSEIIINLAENPTTGYQWELDVHELKVVSLVNENYAVHLDTGIGAAGIKTIKFKTILVGEEDVSLKYWRKWEGDSSIIQRFSVHLKVDN